VQLSESPTLTQARILCDVWCTHRIGWACPSGTKKVLWVVSPRVDEKCVLEHTCWIPRSASTRFVRVCNAFDGPQSAPLIKEDKDIVK